MALGSYRNRSVKRVKGNQATFDNSQRNNLRSCVWVRWSCLEDVRAGFLLVPRETSLLFMVEAIA